jgi:hypothetical protein
MILNTQRNISIKIKVLTMILTFKLKFLTALLLSIIVIACSEDSVLPEKIIPVAPVDSIACADGAEITIDEMIIQNNVWGKGSITNYQQCVRVTRNDTAQTFQWSWNWPAVNNNVKAYPEIIFGLKPFGGISTTDKLPKRIDQINSVDVSFKSLTTTMTGTGNLAFDIWITDSPTPTQNNIKHEIMIWLKNQGQVPAGSFVTRVQVGNEDYDFYSGNVGGWNYHAFVKVIQNDVNQIPVGEFINYLKNNNYILSTEFLSSIEFGNEVVHGTGQTSITDYKISIQ